MRVARQSQRYARKSLLPAILLTLLLPGLGHWRRGDRRHAALFATLPIALLAGTLFTVLAGGAVQILIILVTPGALLLLGALNALLAGWRLAALAHLVRGLRLPRQDRVLALIATILLVVAPHLVVGRSLIAFDELLNETFADVSPTPTVDPSATTPNSTSSLQVSPSAAATRGSGTGTLPSLTVTTPWTRPGTFPWGDDGKFDLLLLGSDAGTDRWSRRMDVMLLVEVEIPVEPVAGLCP